MKLTKRDMVFFFSGITAGVYGTKKAPSSWPVRHVKYVFEIWEAYKRLQKVLVEEYYRIDEAIAAEEAFLSMTRPRDHFIKTYSVVTFEVFDEGGHRNIRMHFNRDEEKAE